VAGGESDHSKHVDFREFEPATDNAVKKINYEWGRDGVDFPHPATEHRERYTWRLAPSRVHTSLAEPRHRESYDMDFLAFQAAADASDEEESSYLEVDLCGNPVKRVPTESPETDDEYTTTTDDKPGQAHSTPPVDVSDLANEPQADNQAPQASIETSGYTIIVETVPEIEFEFGSEPVIEQSSFY